MISIPSYLAAKLQTTVCTDCWMNVPFTTHKTVTWHTAAKMQQCEASPWPWWINFHHLGRKQEEPNYIALGNACLFQWNRVITDKCVYVATRIKTTTGGYDDRTVPVVDGQHPLSNRPYTLRNSQYHLPVITDKNLTLINQKGRLNTVTKTHKQQIFVELW